MQSDVQFVPDDDPPKKFKDHLYDANGNMLPFTLQTRRTSPQKMQDGNFEVIARKDFELRRSFRSREFGQSLVQSKNSTHIENVRFLI